MSIMKRPLGLLLAALLAFSLFAAARPVPAFAEESGEEETLPAGRAHSVQKPLAAGEYSVWVQGVQVTDANKNDVLGDGTVSYAPATKTLTLNNASIQTAYHGDDTAGIYAAEKGIELNIVLKGSNRITLRGGTASNYLEGIVLYGNDTPGKLTISGPGSLVISSGPMSGRYDEINGIYVSGTLAVKGAKLGLDLDLGPYDYLVGIGVNGSGDILATLTDMTADLKVQGGWTDGNSPGTVMRGAFLINGTSSVTVTEKSAGPVLANALNGRFCVEDKASLTVRTTGIANAMEGELYTDHNAKVFLSGEACGLVASLLRQAGSSVITVVGKQVAMSGVDTNCTTALVNTEASAAGCTAWDGTTPLGAANGGSPYKYVQIPGTIAMSGVKVSGLSAKTYTGKAITQSPKLTNGSIVLKEGTDYTVKYTNNVNKGTATVTFTGKGIYSGTLKKTFTIKPAAISKATTGALAAKTYTGSALKPAPTVKFGGKTLKSGTDYTVSYKNNTNAGTATVTIAGKGNFTGSMNKTFTIKPASLKTAKITGLKDMLYTGKAITQTPVVKLGTRTLKAGTDYTVKYAKNTNVGTATVTFTGKGNYVGSAQAAFKIMDPVEEFVARLYRVCLDREPEAQGHAWWVARLRAKQETGGSCAWGFFDSTEFKNHKYNNAAFLDHAYKAFFDRKADAAGKAWWLGEMAKGMTREQVIRNGFAVSNEWKALCKAYQIRP